MSVSLKKGQKISLTKENAGLNQIMIGLGWDEVQQSRGLFARKKQEVDCDASALVVSNGKLLRKDDLVYFGNLRHHSGAIQHMGDNLTGAGTGDDEQILVELKKVPKEYDRIILVVNIYQCIERKQHFGMIHNAFIRIVDGANNQEICRYNLTDDYSGKTAMIFGEVYHKDGEWKFNAVGQGTDDPGLGEMANRYL